MTQQALAKIDAFATCAAHCAWRMTSCAMACKGTVRSTPPRLSAPRDLPNRRRDFVERFRMADEEVAARLRGRRHCGRGGAGAPRADTHYRRARSTPGPRRA